MPKTEVSSRANSTYKAVEASFIEMFNPRKLTDSVFLVGSGLPPAWVFLVVLLVLDVLVVVSAEQNKIFSKKLSYSLKNIFQADLSLCRVTYSHIIQLPDPHCWLFKNCNSGADKPTSGIISLHSTDLILPAASCFHPRQGDGFGWARGADLLLRQPINQQPHLPH